MRLGLGLSLSQRSAGEPSRTNYFLYSEQLDNVAWVKTRSTVTANAANGPLGDASADKLVEDTTATNTHQASQSNVAFTSGLPYTFSIYAKAGERNKLCIQLSTAAFGATVRWYYDLSAVTATRNAAGTNDAGSIVDVGGGWYRCILTATATASATTSGSFLLMNATTTNYTGDGASGLYLWGAQVEQGSGVTSYIATTNVAVTRP